MLLRNPLGFAWRYALGWREPETAEEALDLDAPGFGNLVHGILDAALPAVERMGGLGSAGQAAIAAAVAEARQQEARDWEATQPVPPAILWTPRLDEAEPMALCALCWKHDDYPGQRSHAERLFGDRHAESREAPWDVTGEVSVPGTGLHVLGRIDRLDLSADGGCARVIDYKTGRARNPGVLGGGSELQPAKRSGSSWRNASGSVTGSGMSRPRGPVTCCCGGYILPRGLGFEQLLSPRPRRSGHPSIC